MINDQALTSSKTLAHPLHTLTARPVLWRFRMPTGKWTMGALTFFIGRYGGDSKSYNEDDHSERWLTGALVDELEEGQIYFGESFTPSCHAPDSGCAYQGQHRCQMTTHVRMVSPTGISIRLITWSCTWAWVDDYRQKKPVLPHSIRFHCSSIIISFSTLFVYHWQEMPTKHCMVIIQASLPPWLLFRGFLSVLQGAFTNGLPLAWMNTFDYCRG